MTANSSPFRSTILLAVLLLMAAEARAQDEHVYLIKMFGCKYKPSERSQTGFRARGLKGIVTALHGIADCQRITAISEKGLLLDQPFTIKKIDVDHDVALLSSAQIDSEPDGGFSVAEKVAWESLGTVKVYGHPYGIRSLERTLFVSNPALKPLKDLVPDAPLSILKKRGSPNHLISVLNLEGHLLPGHSGAPILDSQGRVVAVANGGLKEGYAGISWAVPYRDIEWGSVGGKLKELSKFDPKILFTFNNDPLPDSVVSDSENNFCLQLNRVIMASREDFTSIIGEPHPESRGKIFKSKVELPDTVESIIVPSWKLISYKMYETNQKESVQSQYYNLVAKVSECIPSWQGKEGPATKLLLPSKIKEYKFRESKTGVLIDISIYLTNSGMFNINEMYELQIRIYAPSSQLKGYWGLDM